MNNNFDNLVFECEKKIKTIFDEIDYIAYQNSIKVLNSFKEKILLTEGETSERYSRNKMTNMISPSRKTEQNKIEDSMDNNKKLRINNSYTNKSVVIKSENSIVKTQANYRYRNKIYERIDFKKG